MSKLVKTILFIELTHSILKSNKFLKKNSQKRIFEQFLLCGLSSYVTKTDSFHRITIFMHSFLWELDRRHENEKWRLRQVNIWAAQAQPATFGAGVLLESIENHIQPIKINMFIIKFVAKKIERYSKKNNIEKASEQTTATLCLCMNQIFVINCIVNRRRKMQILYITASA